MKILVTGGMGYIGSHTVVELIENGYEVLIYDNLSNSNADITEKIFEITGYRPAYIIGDLRNRECLKTAFSTNKIDAVIHFAGLKAVGESCQNPLVYYDNNVNGTITLLEVMKSFDCKQLIFSSSATVYGNPKEVPVKEDAPLSPANPYGYTKLFVEQILKDVVTSDPSWNITLLRYFNPIGAHKSGVIGETPDGIPNNLLPYIMKVACGQLDKLHIFGNDYPTKDGTGIRDYIHVCDLARGHVLALQHMKHLQVFNLGTGIGYSVFDIVHTFEEVNKIKIPYVIDSRRLGDVPCCFADPSKAEQELGFKANLALADMCKSAYQFAVNNYAD